MYIAVYTEFLTSHLLLNTDKNHISFTIIIMSIMSIIANVYPILMIAMIPPQLFFKVLGCCSPYHTITNHIAYNRSKFAMNNSIVDLTASDQLSCRFYTGTRHPVVFKYLILKKNN